MLTLSIQNLSVHFSGNHVINDVSATLHGGEMVAVVGRNGVGKTTLIKAIARQIKRSGDVALYDDKGNLFSDRDIAYVPQLESVTSRLTAFEMVLLGLVKDLRWKVTDEQIEKFQKAQEQMSGALSKLMAVSEAYPELKANENFRDLQAQLEGTENRITKAVTDFNEGAQEYNTKVRRFPTSIFAGIFGFKTKPHFKAKEGAENAPTVSFE